MNLYAESSAVLAWLLGEEGSRDIREALASAEIVIASDLTLIECERVLIRAASTAQLAESKAADRRARLRHAAEHWTILSLSLEVVERACRPFPNEPIRTLDAIHLATALVARTLVPDTSILSLDERILACAKELGFEVLPA